jgi:hypothetical protein
MFQDRPQTQPLFLLYRLHITLSEFSSAYWLMGREAELQRLIVWATRKRLAKPRQVYQNRLDETQTVLSRIRHQSPYSFNCAQLCFDIADVLFPPPKYPHKGSAAGYKFKPE